MNAQLLIQSHLYQGYHNLHEVFSNFCRQHSELIANYNFDLNALMQQGISEPEFIVIEFIKL